MQPIVNGMSRISTSVVDYFVKIPRLLKLPAMNIFIMEASHKLFNLYDTYYKFDTSVSLFFEEDVIKVWC